MTTRVKQQTDNNISSSTGLGGNVYIWSSNKEKLIDVCHKIDKSPSSIYFNTKHSCWTIRLKCNKHKQKWKNVNFRYASLR